MDRHTYCVLDCIATRQVYDALLPQLTPPTQLAYEASMGVQGVAFAIQLRGLRVDLIKRRAIVAQLKADVTRKEAEINALVGWEINPRSPAMLKVYFYGDLGLREQTGKGTKKVTTDEAALTRIANRTVAVEVEVDRAEVTRRKDVAAAVATLVLECRDLGKRASSLADGLLENGRMRTTYMVNGTESFRFSAHKAWTHKGHNQQNVDKRLRGCFVPDEGYTLGQMDQANAESMVVAYCSGDPAYIAAQDSGYAHAVVGKLIWSELPWPEDLKAAKAWAKKHDRNGEPTDDESQAVYTYAKRIQHGLNFLLSADSLAVHAGMTRVEAKEKYDLYFKTFPGIRAWQQSIIAGIQSAGVIDSPGGFRHLVLGRRSDAATHRAGISRIPQGLVAWTNHLAMVRLFYGLDGEDFQLLAHVHDSLVFQIKPAAIEKLKPQILKLAETRWPVNGRTLLIPFELKFGPTWGDV